MQQDNAPAHKSRKTQLWFVNAGFDVLPWPAQSPDLNPIENLWGYLKQKVDAREVHGLDGLWKAVQEEWAAIPGEFLEKLADSMPQRIQAVIKSKGGATRY